MRSLSLPTLDKLWLRLNTSEETDATQNWIVCTIAFFCEGEKQEREGEEVERNET